MIYDTAGNKIIEPIANCDCGLTGGCEKCNPSLYKSKLPGFIGCISDEEAEEMKKKLNKWKQRFDNDFNERHLKLWGKKIIGDKFELLP